MKSNWQPQKSKFEIDEAASNGDFTGGYNFLPWVWYMRRFFIAAIIIDLLIGCKLVQTYNEYQELVTGIAAAFFGLTIPIIIITLLVREFNRKKKGISQ